MLSLEPELQSLRPILGDARAGALIARERREIFSLHPELRIGAWLGATLLATAAGILLKNNLERLGPLVLAILIALAAAACYAWTWFRRSRASVVDDYVLLLGALLVSADVAFIEAQFHLFDGAWRRHLFILAVLHAAAAYAYGSRMVLSLSIVAFAGWIGFDKGRRFDELYLPALITAALLVVWRAVDRRWRGDAFSRTFEHFAAHIALTGGMTYMIRDVVRGGLLTLAIAAIVIAWGFRSRSEPFVLYGFVYAVIALDAILLEQFLGSTKAEALTVIVLSMIGAIAALIALHAHFREVRS
ncbi:MAG TPA: DUF2157 domain-containing protein [Thermoanaerobaculia bacterium]|nr:DUF2157 domain-containing protein [Thermoanaerobaculia bacterium]